MGGLLTGEEWSALRLSFQVAVRLTSPGHLPAWLKAQIRTPGGVEIASATRAVAFDKDQTDVLFKFDAISVQSAGSYLLSVNLDGASTDVPLTVVGPQRSR